eukprot:CAMPEP_0170589412 /NCGR_PEP_ID=MMETSP0224-20130122/11336_1 /TAXON_ID=285029 /ORGANISM="Togula jolla, Strain CCCM 725" /LENGTH=90 /DNA_ID=CAMNT_0010913167 /DNA_START=91 /DNA_END=363 /DNA_ORIENTATION=+
MQNLQSPSDAVTELAQRKSVGNTILRGLSRNGVPSLPFVPRAPVQNSESAQGWTLSKDFNFGNTDNPMTVVFVPLTLAFGAVIMIGKYLR